MDFLKSKNNSESDNSIAIVGMSCKFAGSAHHAEFWRNIMRKKNLLTYLSDDVALPFGEKALFERTYPPKTGQLGNLYSCVSLEQDFPRQINVGENQDLFFATQLAFDAMTDAGLRPHQRPELNASVHLGYAPPFNSSTVNWLDHTLFIDQTIDIITRFFPNAPSEAIRGVKQKLSESLPMPNAESFLTSTGSFLALWISYQAGFSGPADAVDAGSVSCTTCIQSAMVELLSGQVDVALVGAVSPPLTRAFLQGITGTVAFSSSGDILPFSSKANGTLPGEGGAFFVLKRRADAIAAHDRIYALIKSTAFDSPKSSDSETLSTLMNKACDTAKINPSSIRLLEAEGNGIPNVDAMEAEAIKMFTGLHTPGKPLLGVGSVKGNIGHCLHASASASIAKSALALYHRVLPPQIQTPLTLESLSNAKSGAYIISEALPWITGDATSPRRAAVNTIDFFGRSSVLILEEEPESHL